MEEREDNVGRSGALWLVQGPNSPLHHWLCYSKSSQVRESWVNGSYYNNGVDGMLEDLFLWHCRLLWVKLSYKVEGKGPSLQD